MRLAISPVLSALLLVPAVLFSPATQAQNGGPRAAVQPADASSKYAIPGCTTDRTPPTDADQALTARKYPDAERLYNEALSADPNSSGAMAGLVRTTLAEGKLPEALAEAQKFETAHANNAFLEDTLAEVRFRRGETDEAGMALNRAVKLDRCNALTHYDMARYLYLLGLYASSQREIERAYWLAPLNSAIAARWHSTHAVPQTAEQRLAMLQKRLDNPSLTDPQKDAINAAIKGIQSSEKGGCELVSPIEEIKLPIVPVPDNGSIENMEEGGLDLLINGKKRRLEIDTGASGLTLSAPSAKALGLVPEAQIKVGGIGDDGPANAFVSHVDDIKIGKMEFHNCVVQVLAPGNMLDRVADVDGLIGPDVFRNYLVTLDYPGRELRLGPLPRLPDQQAAKPISLATSDDTETQVSFADSARDRYVAPEMKDWTPVFRSQHMLIVPTLVNNSPVKLFLLDTGSQMSLLSPSAAKEVGQASDFTGLQMKGVNGTVRKVPAVGNVSMTFAQIRQTRRSMLILDTGGISRNVGAEMSGIIGIPILRELVLSIDYRDNLIHVVYDPKKGFHARNDNGAALQ
ncbi:MAG TPA: aspartyl protease family protein [Acidobacteriaceae bacterium]